MMELKVSEWKEFRVDRLFLIHRGDRIVKNEDYFDEPADETYIYPVVTASATNNGVDGLYNQYNCKGQCIVSCGEANGMFTTWQAKPFWGMDTIRIYHPIGFAMTEQLGLFFATILSHNMYRFSYGRKAKPDNMYSLFLRLPIQHDASGQPVIDPRKKYSDDGYVPDWDFMEQYMKSLNHPSLTTNRGYKYPTLGVDKWKEFQVGRLFQLNIARSVDYGNTTEGNTIFVGRTSENNGVQGYVSETPVEDGNCIIIGMVGSNLAFYQDKPFAASQNILVLRNDMLNRSIAMFLCTVLSKCVEIYRDTYSLPLGKEKIKSRGIKLPVQHDASGQPLIDPPKKYSDDGYIPDWAFMEQYIESLPGSDLLK